MNLPTSESIPDDFNALSPAQKRRIRYAIQHASDSEVQVFLSELKRRATPSFEFFLLALLGSIVAAVGILLDSPIILMLAVIASPFLTPLIGLSISPAIKSFNFFLKSLAGILISSVIFFLGGVLAGLISRLLPLRVLSQLPQITTPNWISWLVLIIASVFTAIFFVRHEENPRLIGTLLSYLIFIPVSAAGFYLSIDSSTGWLQTLQFSALHLVVSAIIISIVFMILGLHPKNSIGWILFFLMLACATILTIIYLQKPQTTPEDVITKPLPTSTYTPTSTRTNTPIPPTPTNTHTPTFTLTPTPTMTVTFTPTPTMAWAEVNSVGGIVIREEPGGSIVATAMDGSLLQIGYETIVEGNRLWVKVLTTNGISGWALASLLSTVTATP